ncbi:MAG TPA: PKD domain-containing protein [Cytophagales bacterium]|nr:PKD domain-containing protein [Cytophagales bacterium]
MRKNITSYKKRISLLIITLLLTLLSFKSESQCANGNLLSKGNYIANAKGCAGINTVQIKILYGNLESDAKINVDWGIPGGTIDQYDYTSDNEGAAGSFEKDLTKIYPKKGGICTYTIRIWVTNTCYPVTDTEQIIQNVVVWDTDINNFQVAPNVVRVCQDTYTEVTFRDAGPWNCFPVGTTANRNIVPRHLQFVYGEGGANSLQGIEVGGVTYATPFPDAVEQHNAPGQYTADMIVVPQKRPDGTSHAIGDRFFVTLNIWNQCNPYPGTPEKAIGQIVIVAAPNPLFERRKTSMSTPGDELNFCPNETIYLKNLTTVASGGSYQYTWKFYDNNNVELASKTGKDATHSFSTPGDYKVKLSIKDGNAIGNCIVDLEKNIRVDAAPAISIDVNGANSTSHSFCKTDRTNPFSLAINGTLTSGNAYTYEWELYKRNSTSSTPDSSYSNSSSTSLSLNFDKPGIFKIRLSAKDNLTQCENFKETTILIQDRPTPAFDASEVCEGTRTHFSNISKKTASIPVRIDGDEIVKWEWDFNSDGTIDLTRNDDSDFDYFLASPFGPSEPSASIGGTYNITLTVTTNKGCSYSIDKDVKVKAAPLPSFTMNPVNGEICNGGSISFTSTTPSAPVITSYLWDFGPNATPQTRSGTNVDDVQFINNTGADIVYNAKLTVTTDEGCVNSFTKQITIHPAPPVTISSDFDANKPNCSPISVNFLHNADPAIVNTYNWVIENLNTGTIVYNNASATNVIPFTPAADVFVNNNPTTDNVDYQIKLIVKYSNGCEVTSNPVKVTVKPNPIADFTADFLNDCSPKKVNFNPNISGAAYYEWKFQNGHIPEYSSNTSYLPEIIFTNKSSETKDYTVSLTITTVGGCKNTVTRKITVKPQPDPQFKIIDNRILCSGDALEFVNSTLPGALVTKYVWIWGDGTPNTEVLASVNTPVFHTFRNNSTDTTAIFDVKLLAISDCESFSNQQSIIVSPKLLPEFDLFGANCSPAKITASSKSKGPVSKIYWFIDGNQQTTQGDNVTFDLINTGNVNKNFDITMKIVSDNGCDTSITKSIIVYPKAVPTFTVTPETMTTPDHSITIENLTAGEWEYEWDFGDGSPLFTGRDPKTHTFPGIGNYRITLTISSEYCKASTFKTVIIFGRKPIANFGPDNVEGCMPLTVNFNNKSLHADSTKYEWDFGDGKGKSTLINPTYTYTEPGTYSVRLIAKNAQNVVDDTVRIDAIKVYDIPKASFLARPIEVELPDKPVYLTNQSMGADAFLWDFGDGNFSTEADPAHIYQDTGRYTITLIAYNSYGCTDTAVVENAVKAVYGGRVLIPNAFSPSLSALGVGSSENNDYFFPIAEGVVAIDLKIFNRWGEVMYYTNNIDDNGWDGFYNGRLCQQDVYIYSVKMKFKDGYEFNKTGDVVLIR